MEKKEKPAATNDIIAYEGRLSAEFRSICKLLRTEIGRALKDARIYYANPVWFIGENPILGYTAAKASVNLLFWSGQSFPEKGLTPAGKFKAAQIKYSRAEDIDVKKLRTWLVQSKQYIWDYSTLRENKGQLVKFRWKTGKR